MIPHDQMSDDDPWYVRPCPRRVSVRSFTEKCIGSRATHRDDLRAGVVWAAAARLEELAAALESGHAKVGNLDVALAVEEQVLGLEVAVADVEPVAVVDARDDLLEVVQRLVRAELALLHEVVKQLPAGHVLHDQVPARRQSVREGARRRAGTGTHSSDLVSQTSIRRRTFGCSISFMMTISRSIPRSICSRSLVSPSRQTRGASRRTLSALSV